MNIIFEIIDKRGKKVRLTQKQWSHITSAHAEMTNYLEEIRQTLEEPLKITFQEKGNLMRYYSYQKHRKHPEKYLRAIVKYLNGEGFIVTAQFVRYIK